MKTLKMVLFLVVFAVSGAVFARAPEPVINLVDQPVATASGKALTAQEVKQLITKVATDKRWVVTPTQNGTLVASLNWNRNKHTIAVEIAYQADRYSVAYKDSVNMNYMVRDGGPEIHPYYNRHVNDLREAIRFEMLRM